MAISKSDLDKMSLEELKQLQNDVAVALHDYETRRKAEAKAALEAKAREFGFSVDELLNAEPSKNDRRKQPVAPKYADPDDASKTWSGRGRKPKWVEACLASGKTLDDLKI